MAPKPPNTFADIFRLLNAAIMKRSYRQVARHRLGLFKYKKSKGLRRILCEQCHILQVVSAWQAAIEQMIRLPNHQT